MSETEGWNRIFLGRPDRSKFADSQDSFLLYYRRIDPRQENFVLSATFVVTDDARVDFQTGYGIMAVDTVVTFSHECRHRNYVLLGRSRTVEGKNYGLGLRLVGGYTDAFALRQSGRRRLDSSRLFPTQPATDVIRKGDRHRFILAKTDTGFEASLCTETGVEKISLRGCDFLLKQDKEAIYVGFAVAGLIALQLEDVRFETTSGRLSHTPAGTIRKIVPDYPFCCSALAEPAPVKGDRQRAQLFRVTPGDDGLALATVLGKAGPGCEIILADGVYAGGPYYIPRWQSGKRRCPIILRAEHPGKAILDGSAMDRKLPLMTLRADWWIVEGLVFRKSPSSGLFLCGSNNRVRNCESYDNKDTGVLICSFPRSRKRDWPSHNRIESCCSHDNCDSVRANADGFGAKLSVGKGNCFHSCKAHHNIDDGFDLYTKTIIGKIGSVSFSDCEAFCNGFLSGEPVPKGVVRNGIGFKLGGESLQIHHRLSHCSAYGNARKGFDENSNHACRMEDCKEWDNPQRL